MGSNWPLPPQKSSVTLFTSDTHQSRLHPQVCIGDAVAPLNRTPKILGVTLDTHFTFGPHTCNCIERASRAFNVMKALIGWSWGFTTKTLVATCKAIVRPILNYAAPIRFTQVSSSHLDKLEVIQNKSLNKVLRQRPPTPAPQSPPLPTPQGYPPGIIPPHSSHGPGHRRYVDGTPLGHPIPGRAPPVQQPAPIATTSGTTSSSPHHFISPVVRR